MKIKSIYIIGLMVFLGVQLFGQSEKKLVREGNNLYEDGNFQEAEIEYRKALSEKPDYHKGKFNLGDAMYSQENFEESGKIYSELGEISKTAEIKSGSWYNLGNSLMQQQKYKESIEAYKKALRVNPDDQDAKYNLEYARQMLNEQQQQQNQDQNQENKDQEQDQDQKSQEQQEDQNKEQQDQNQEQDQKDQKDQQQDQGDPQQQQNQPQPQQISKEDAQRMLDALKNDEKKTLQELQEQKAKATKTKKSEIDW
ncbi:MAG: tetratricopeptide repeat protein [Bacteroidales bacterium]|jgi:tetratricopeptide (TPR) repeat protein|nr:tetratricopeptide repeat protein [Bacteroidales bacterium]